MRLCRICGVQIYPRKYPPHRAGYTAVTGQTWATSCRSGIDHTDHQAGIDPTDLPEAGTVLPSGGQRTKELSKIPPLHIFSLLTRQSKIYKKTKKMRENTWCDVNLRWSDYVQAVSTARTGHTVIAFQYNQTSQYSIPWYSSAWSVQGTSAQHSFDRCIHRLPRK